MGERNGLSLKVGDKVKIKSVPKPSVLPFLVVGLTEGDSLVFLQPSSFSNNSRSLHAVMWDKEDLVRSKT